MPTDPYVPADPDARPRQQQNLPPGLAPGIFRLVAGMYLPATGQRLTGAGEWRSERRTLPRGTLIVPLAQARAELAGHLLEPNGPDSLFSWGTFNAAFQQQEYVEAYLLEPWAEQALKTEAALRSAFEQRMADPAFAADAGARRRFFAERHPSFDTRIRELPVLRVTSPLGPER